MVNNYNGWDINWKRDQYTPVFINSFSESDAATALNKAWKMLYGTFPEPTSLAILWAHSALETGRWKQIANNNFGNIKKTHYKKLSYKTIEDDGHKWTMFATGENLVNPQTKKTEWHWFEPPHYQTHFRSYDTIIDGAVDYIKFVSGKERYKNAWKELLNGDPKKYSHELRLAGYYTASEEKYTAGVIRLFDEFISKIDTLITKEKLVAVLSIPPPIVYSTKSIEPMPVILADLNKEKVIITTEHIKIVEKNNSAQKIVLAIAAVAITIFGWLSQFF